MIESIMSIFEKNNLDRIDHVNIWKKLIQSFFTINLIF